VGKTSKLTNTYRERIEAVEAEAQRLKNWIPTWSNGTPLTPEEREKAIRIAPATRLRDEPVPYWWERIRTTIERGKKRAPEESIIDLSLFEQVKQ